MPVEHGAISEEFLLESQKDRMVLSDFLYKGIRNSRKISDGEKVVKSATGNLGLSNGRLVFAEKGAGREYFRNPVDPFSVDASLNSVVILPFPR